MMIVRESSPLRELATVESITSSELEIPIDEDEAEAQWAGETEARSETTTARVGMQTIPVWEIYAKQKATPKFLEDSGVDVPAWLARKGGERLGRQDATRLVAGTGAKQPPGLGPYP